MNRTKNLKVFMPLAIVRKCAQRCCLTLLVCVMTPWAHGQTVELDASLNETVQMVPKPGLFTLQLETTFYKPDGPGPFPIAIINHGKSPGNTYFQSRSRPANAARYFLQRGYAVVVPMRQGFSKSGGSYVGVGCNIESNGMVQAEDVKAVLDYVVMQSWADKNNIVVVGQSHGGWTTLAFGTQNYPGVKALINFAGGLRQESCAAWEGGLAKAAGRYGRTTRVPSLWFYGDNDSFFKRSTSDAMFEQYTASGGQARFVAFGTFGTDSHAMFGSRKGTQIWQPEVTQFLSSVGLPSEVISEYARFGRVTLTEVPPKTDYAVIEDETKLPFVRDTGRAGYTAYLTKLMPRAFAIASNGGWGFADGGDDPLKRALDFCNQHSNGKSDCKLYSVDDFVVWKGE